MKTVQSLSSNGAQADRCRLALNPTHGINTVYNQEESEKHYTEKREESSFYSLITNIDECHHIDILVAIT